MLLKEDLIMVNKELLFSRNWYIFLFFTCLVFFNVSFFPTKIVAENLTTSGGTIDLVDNGRLVVNDSNFRLLETVKYLDEKGVPVDTMGLKAGNYIIFQANIDGEIIQITAVSSTKAQMSPFLERIKHEAIDSKKLEGQQRELRLKNGVWAN